MLTVKQCVPRFKWEILENAEKETSFIQGDQMGGGVWTGGQWAWNMWKEASHFFKCISICTGNSP